MFRQSTIFIRFSLGLSVLLLGLAGPASAQLAQTFEIEGNAISEPADGDDWDSLYVYDTAGWSLQDLNPDLDGYTGVIMDFGDVDTTRFAVGSKDIHPISEWAWVPLPPSDKDDLTNGQVCIYSPGANQFLYMALDRFSNNGDAYMGVWLLHDGTINYLPDGTWSGQHVAGIPGDTAAVDPRGDILILSHYTNGGVADSIAVFEWVESGGNSDDILGSQGSDAIDIIYVDPTIAFGAVNQVITPAPWPYLSRYGDTADFPFASFYECALDLGAFFGDDIQSISKVLFETREAPSLTAALSDFVLSDFSILPADCCIPPIRGNVDYDAEDNVNIVDLTHLVAYLFGDGDAPPCMEEADVNADGVAEPIVNIVDLTHLVAHLFSGGDPPEPCP